MLSGVQFFKTAVVLCYERGKICTKERQMIYLKRTRTADELLQFINGTLEDEDYFFEITDALYTLSIKDFYNGREEEMISHFSRKVPVHIKDKDNDAFYEMCFGEALLAAEDAGVIKGDCLVTFFMLMRGAV